MNEYRTRLSAATGALREMERCEVRVRADREYVRKRLQVVHEHIANERKFAATRHPEIAMVIESGLQGMERRIEAILAR